MRSTNLLACKRILKLMCSNNCSQSPHSMTVLFVDFHTFGNASYCMRLYRLLPLQLYIWIRTKVICTICLCIEKWLKFDGLRNEYLQSHTLLSSLPFKAT